MGFYLHKKVFVTLLRELESLVEGELTRDEKTFTKEFSESGSIAYRSNYFGVSEARKDDEGFPNVFGNALKKLALRHHPRYSKRRLFDTYSWYEKQGGEWIPEEEGKRLNRNYINTYLTLLSKTWEDLLNDSNLTPAQRREQQKFWDEAPKKKGEGEKQVRYYLATYLSWSDEQKDLQHALLRFVTVRGKVNLSGEVVLSKTPLKKEYKGTYTVLKEKENYSNNALKLSLSSDNRPLEILIHKNTTLPFTHFNFLMGNFTLIDKEYHNIQGAVLLERLPKGKEDMHEKMTSKELGKRSQLGADEQLLLLSHLRHLNETDILPVSVFDNVEDLITHMESTNPWWKWQKRFAGHFFGNDSLTQCFYLYFLAKRKSDAGEQLFLARYPMKIEKAGNVRVWGKAVESKYEGSYQADMEDAIHVEIKKADTHGPDYFHLFLQEEQGDGHRYLAGLYAGWRMKRTGLANFSGAIVAIPVAEENWKEEDAEFFPLSPQINRIEEPAWRIEVRKHPAILPHLLGLKQFAIDNGLFFLPGSLMPYVSGVLHEDLKSMAGVYYYYRTRTRPGRQYTVKAYAVLIDHDGFVYVKSHKAGEGALLYRGTLISVRRKRADIWSAVAVLEKSKGDFGGMLILERPLRTPELDIDYDFRGLHLSLNYYGDPIAGRLYFVRESSDVDWELFQEMESPKYFVEKWEEETSALYWYESRDLQDDHTEKLGDKVADEAKRRLLDRLCGQINNFMAFRNSELGVRTNKVTNLSEGSSFYPALFKGNYAEDALRAAVTYWKWEERDEKKFQDAFLTAILQGGYSHIGNLRKWFVEDPEMKGCKEVLYDLLDAIRGGRVVRPEKCRRRVKYILDEMFEEV